MRWKQFALWILATALRDGRDSPPKSRPIRPCFRQWIANQTKFSFVGGRVVGNTNNGAWMFGMPKQVSTEGPVREQINFNGNGSHRVPCLYLPAQRRPGRPSGTIRKWSSSLTSVRKAALSCATRTRTIRRSTSNLTQVPGQPVSLSLPPSDKPRVLRAPTIWHLLIIHAEDCRKQFLPMLESIRHGLAHRPHGTGRRRRIGENGRRLAQVGSQAVGGLGQSTGRSA